MLPTVTPSEMSTPGVSTTWDQQVEAFKSAGWMLPTRLSRSWDVSWLVSSPSAEASMNTVLPPHCHLCCQPRPLARKLWERQGQFRKSQAVLEPFVAVLANSRSPSLLVLAKTESMKHGRRRSGTIRRKEERILLLYGLDQPQLVTGGSYSIH
ncbi:hypothetical protein O3P69_012409 [Scylla paramamosain]|uniref:Uncharacterized protein n=1 Tax=Scylla paramamosain TaxID=85552 RepID=A0AAW0SER0_SCYPA